MLNVMFSVALLAEMEFRDIFSMVISFFDWCVRWSAEQSRFQFEVALYPV
jgi:hypothetical protein